MTVKKFVYRIVAWVVFHLKISHLIESVFNGTKQRRENTIRFSTSRIKRFLSPSAGFQILIYHNVAPQRDPFSIDTVTHKEFEAQVHHLCSCYTIYPLEFLIDEMRNGRVYDRAIAITFDDGYQNLFHYAFPVLKKYNAPATVFLVSDLIDTPKRLWFDRALMFIKHYEKENLHIERDGVELRLKTNTEAGKIHAAQKLLEFLKHLPPRKRDMILKELEHEQSHLHVDCPDKQLLTWKQIEAMQKHGIAFGSHTKQHNVVTTLSQPELNQEIAGSKALIEAHLQRPVNLFAYPNGRSGDFNATARSLLKKYGFKAAVSTIRGLNTPSTDPFALRRFRPWQTDVELFALQLTCERLQLSWRRESNV